MDSIGIISLTISVPDPCLLHLVLLFQSERLRGRLRSKHWILHPLVIPTTFNINSIK